MWELLAIIPGGGLACEMRGVAARAGCGMGAA